MTAYQRRKALPKLAESLRCYKRRAVNQLANHVRDLRMRSPRIARHMSEKLDRLRAKPPAAFRDWYLAERVKEIRLDGIVGLKYALLSIGRTFVIL